MRKHKQVQGCDGVEDDDVKVKDDNYYDDDGGGGDRMVKTLVMAILIECRR